MWTVEVPVSVQSWGRFGGAAARADRLLAIKELKIDVQRSSKTAI